MLTARDQIFLIPSGEEVPVMSNSTGEVIKITADSDLVTMDKSTFLELQDDANKEVLEAPKKTNWFSKIFNLIGGK